MKVVCAKISSKQGAHTLTQEGQLSVERTAVANILRKNVCICHNHNRPRTHNDSLQQLVMDRYLDFSGTQDTPMSTLFFTVMQDKVDCLCHNKECTTIDFLRNKMIELNQSKSQLFILCQSTHGINLSWLSEMWCLTGKFTFLI